MSKQLESIVNRFSMMSKRDKYRLVFGIRERRFKIKPSTKKRKEKKDKVKKKASNKKLSTLLNKLTPEQLQALLSST